MSANRLSAIFRAAESKAKEAFPEKPLAPLPAVLPLVVFVCQEIDAIKIQLQKKSPKENFRLKRYSWFDKLGRERCAATAAAGGVRVLEREPRTHHVRRVVDHHSIEILG
jgi:hypothetical protein